MSESMTRGAEVMLLQGTTMRHDRAGMALTMPLPCGNAGPTPLMIDPERFGGLIAMGITEISQGCDALSVTTATGLRARLPALADPHRNMTLEAGSEPKSIAPALFTEWLAAGLALTAASGSAVLYTYRSNAFVFTRLAMAAARLSAGWPMPSVMDATQLRDIKRLIGQAPVDSVQASRALLLVKSQGRVLRLEAREATMPAAPIELLAQCKVHRLASMGEIESAALAAAVTQIALTHAAHGPLREDAGDPRVEVRLSLKGMALRTKLASVEIPGQLPSAQPVVTSLSALKILQAAPQFGDATHLVAYPDTPGATAIAMRAASTSMRVAAQLPKADKAQ